MTRRKRMRSDSLLLEFLKLVMVVARVLLEDRRRRAELEHEYLRFRVPVGFGVVLVSTA